MASRIFSPLVSSLSFLSLLRGATQRSTLQQFLPLSRATVQRKSPNNVLRKTVHFSSIWRNYLPCIGLSSTEKKDGRTNGGSWQSLSGFGITFMVGGFVINSVDNERQKTPAGAAAFEGPSELRGECGRFVSKSRVGKRRSGTDRTRGIRDWRAKRKLEFTDENEPPAKRETRTSKNQKLKEDYIPHGSRIIDLDELRNGLKSCQHCKSAELSLCNITKEKRCGLASIFSVNCVACGEENEVKTSSDHRSGQRGPLTHDINSRAVLGCLHTGIGETHLNNLLSTLNVPSMNPVTFKSREREAGAAVELVAKKSCQESMFLERSIAIEEGTTPDEQGLVSLTCSYDMGWQKRGKGHNSSTGQAAVMGSQTGKVLDFTTRTKSCRVCKNAEKRGEKAREHDCRVNHFASSKAMEPLAAVDLFTRSLTSNVKLSVYTGDDDSTTAAHIKQKVPYAVEKWTDIVHAKRSLTTRLYNLAQRGKFKNSSVLSQRVISYLVKCFSYSVAQNKGNPDALKKALKSIVPHAFGDHASCDGSWCRAKQDPNYKHTDLPYGKDLFGDELQKAVQTIFDEYCTDIVVAKLAPAANSQRNEALNSVIGSKNPKIRYYGGSQSNDFRVACGICQINLGYQYISNTLNSLNIESGKYCLDHTKKMDHKAKLDKVRKTNLNYKRRRAQLHKQKLKNDGNKEAKEGKTYQSDIGLNLDPNSPSGQVVHEIDVNVKITKEELQQFEKFLPKLSIRPAVEKNSFNTNNVYNFITFDIETNTSGKTAEICQLSALDRSGLFQFNEYILPSNDVNIHASKVNKLTVRRVNGMRTLFKEDQPVVSVSLQTALENFLVYIEQSIGRLKCNNKIIYTVLIGHNSQTFDTPILLRQGENQFCSRLTSNNVFFSDSLILIRKLVKSKHPSLCLSDGLMSKTNQQSLYKTLFHESFVAHDAVEDVKALRKILFDSSLKITDQMLIEDMTTASHAEMDMKYLDHRYELLQTFKGNLFHPTSRNFPITAQMAEKIAGSGLSYQDLQNIFARFGENGLVGVLSLPPSTSQSKSPRVTRTSRVLASVISHFKREKSQGQKTVNSIPRNAP